MTDADIDLPTQIEWVRQTRDQLPEGWKPHATWTAVLQSLEAQAAMYRIALGQIRENVSGLPDDHADDISCINGSLQVCPSGIEFFFMSPTPEMIQVPDMAHHLARIPRFGGGSDGSVAQHLVQGVDLLEDLPHKRCYFLHDAEEYVTGDCPSPLKKLIGPKFKGLANGVRAAIFDKFGLPIEWAYTIPDIVKQADNVMFQWERRDQMPTVPWIEKHALPEHGPYTAWSRNEAEMRFLQRFAELWPEYEF